MSSHPQPSKNNSADDAAINLIRSRIDQLYGDDVATAKNDTEPEKLSQPQPAQKISKHQQYMKQLSESGRPLAEIQADWNNYYQGLTNDEKHEVWQEFYANHGKKTTASTPATNTDRSANKKPAGTSVKAEPSPTDRSTKKTKRTTTKLKKRLTKKSTPRQKAKLSAKDHFKSLLFGVSIGGLVMLVLLFSFFNERFIAPFITPSKNVSSTPIIIDPNATPASNEAKIIIPKINVEVPVVYGMNSIQEDDIQSALEDGVVHYANTPSPGERGNSVIVGHSSNNLFNRGRYKFAFVLLNQLVIGDTFSVTKDGTRYVYRVAETKIVPPTDVSVLNATSMPATMTIITCDPPGTAINRLVVVGEQISPDPINNKASTSVATGTATPNIVPGNAPSLWSRLTNWLSS